MNKSKVLVILKILVSISLLTLLCWMKREKFNDIWNLLQSINTAVFALAFLIFTLTLGIMSWRLKIALTIQ
ncbi:MAG: hypothetical protein NG712_00810, partial [Omnitrophica bacterium]|nr:hypothetical protein [Candidatus Omnitrophota bacterium]